MTVDARPTVAPPAIPGVDSFVLEPPGLGVALRISIAVSSGVGDGPLGVAYVTDADMCYGTVTEQARLLNVGGEISPIAIVGIGYAAETGNYAFTSLRRGTDFYSGARRTITLPGAGDVVLGGAGDFLAALRTVVFPAVESRLPRIDPTRRALFGTSAGGHFAAYALVSAPDAFAGYAMMSPNLMAFPPTPAGTILIDAVRALPPGTIPAGTRVFLSAGENEDTPGTPLAMFRIAGSLAPMQDALEAHGATVERVIFPGESHTSVSGAAISRALRWLFPPTTASDWQARLAAVQAKD